MNIILGGNGHVGSAVAKTLLAQGEAVTVLSRNSASAPRWREQGAQVEIVDVHDTAALHKVFSKGKRLFLLNPPADPAGDTDTEERKTVASILEAVRDSGLEKIVALSTYGAQPGGHIGDLGVLYEMEQQLAQQPIPYTLIRAAYYMSNWMPALEIAKEEGIVHTFFPLDFVLPAVAPEDIGKFAAGLMTQPTEQTGLHYFEGPERYTALDLASAFSKTLKKEVKAVVTPRDQWGKTMIQVGFSEAAANSFANMTDKAIEAALPDSNTVERGTISLESYIEQLVSNSKE